MTGLSISLPLLPAIQAMACQPKMIKSPDTQPQLD